MLADLAGVTYRMRIGESRVVVGRDNGEADYGAEVQATFARFRQPGRPQRHCPSTCSAPPT